jgi:hypothetical protein
MAPINNAIKSPGMFMSFFRKEGKNLKEAGFQQRSTDTSEFLLPKRSCKDISEQAKSKDKL